MARSAGKLLWFLQQDLRWTPMSRRPFELGIGGAGGPGAAADLPGGRYNAVKVIGKIDQVDVQNGPTGAADRLRVVDYKTGTKNSA